MTWTRVYVPQDVDRGIRDWAMRVSKTKRSASVRNKKIGAQGSIETDVIGRRGEWAVARFFDCLTDDEITEAGHKRADLVVESGDDRVTLEVKTMRAGGRLLLVHDLDSIRADYLVLCCDHVDMYGYVSILGCVTAERFKREKVVRDLNYGNTNAMLDADLDSMAVLQRFRR